MVNPPCLLSYVDDLRNLWKAKVVVFYHRCQLQRYHYIENTLFTAESLLIDAHKKSSQRHLLYSDCLFCLSSSQIAGENQPIFKMS